MKKSTLSIGDRLMTFVSPEPNTGCWIWTGCIDRGGYGRFQLVSRKSVKAHRVAYSEFVGPIPPGLHIDHLCRVRCCVNPRHLEAVTQAVNNQRGIGGKMAAKYKRGLTHCKRGHEYTPENTWHNGLGRDGLPRRYCRECKRTRDARAA